MDDFSFATSSPAALNRGIIGFNAFASDFGVIYDVFPAVISILNIFGVLLVGCLYYKGLRFPSTADCGSSGSFLSDYAWGASVACRRAD